MKTLSLTLLCLFLYLHTITTLAQPNSNTSSDLATNLLESGFLTEILVAETLFQIEYWQNEILPIEANLATTIVKLSTAPPAWNSSTKSWNIDNIFTSNEDQDQIDHDEWFINEDHDEINRLQADLSVFEDLDVESLFNGNLQIEFPSSLKNNMTLATLRNIETEDQEAFDEVQKNFLLMSLISGLLEEAKSHNVSVNATMLSQLQDIVSDIENQLLSQEEQLEQALEEIETEERRLEPELFIVQEDQHVLSTDEYDLEILLNDGANQTEVAQMKSEVADAEKNLNKANVDYEDAEERVNGNWQIYPLMKK